jgi:hypothetical protein
MLGLSRAYVSNQRTGASIRFVPAPFLDRVST